MARANRNDLKPKKGYHFDTGSFVEYEGQVNEPDRQNLIEQLNHHCKEII